MSQHDYVIDNQTFPATRTDINNALAAIVTTNAGATAPSTTYAYQLWYDTTNDILKMRNSDDDAWIDLFDINQTTDAASAKLGADVTISGDLTVDTNTLHVDSTNNSVGIGTTSPSTSHKITLDHTSNYGGISLKQSGTQVGQIIQEGGTGNVYVDADSGSLGGSLILRTSNTERARITSNGITFNGDTAAANALDDYEESTWSPIVSDGTNTVTFTDKGTATKIGRLVCASFDLYNVSTSSFTSSASVRIQGLPFTSQSTHTASCYGFIAGITANTPLVFYVNTSASEILVFSAVSSTQNLSNLTFASLGANVSIRGEIFYLV